MKTKNIIYYVIAPLLLLTLIFGIRFIINHKYVGYKRNAKEFEIVQNTNAGIPYTWKYEIKDKDIIKFVKKSSKQLSNKEISGGRVREYYKFKALKKGKTTITFNFVNFTNNKIDKTKTYNIIVDDRLNVYIKEKTD